jgi:dihydropteroate synthase
MSEKPKIMGILNVTPDSFYDGGRYIAQKKLTTRIKRLIKQRADIIDVGGQSTRPNSTGVTAQTETKRVIPAIKQIRSLNKKVCISIDTSRPKVAVAALEAGANIINDITGLKNPAMVKTVKKYNCRYVIIMHMRATPKTMQKFTRYKDILAEIYAFFDRKIKELEKSKIAKSKIIIDPGIGFAKTFEQNLFLIKNLSFFKKLGCKVLLGASRKSFIGVTLNQKNPKDRLLGSLASAMYGYLKGADILRVHDVKETKEMVDMAYALQNAKL